MLFKTLDSEFDRAIYQINGVVALLKLVSERYGHIDRRRSLSLMDEGKGAKILAEPEEIFWAISLADGTAAEAATRGHLNNGPIGIPND